jgi:hypothetical protein
MSLKVCPECKTSFTCEGEKDCWCESYQIHKKEMLIITSKYNDCLCPDCLRKYAE